MRKILFLAFTINVLISCKSKTSVTNKDSTVKSSLSISQTQQLIKKFKPIIQGVWVKADYIDKLIKTKSPLAASDLATGLTTIYINTDDIKGDSIVSMGGYGNHDGANCIIKFQPGKTPSSILFNGRDLSFSIDHGDTTLIFFQYDDKKKQFVKAKYIRALKREPDDDLGDGLDLLVNRALVTGSYILVDSLGTNSRVYFTEDGKVHGFLNCKSYKINVDLNSDANDNLDGIYFKTANKENRNYTFKIDADTLNLYDTYENADSSQLVIGKLKYKLVRQK